MLQLRANQGSYLSQDQIRRVAPAIFAEEPWEGVSDRYAFIPTYHVVKRMEEHGFVPVMVAQGKCRTKDKSLVTKHEIRYRRICDLGVVGEVVPEVLQLNSHDRTSRYKLYKGLFRFFCWNGMIVGDMLGPPVNVMHSGDIAGEVIEASYRILDEMPAVLDHVEEMKQIEWSPEHARAFATAAHTLRWEPGEHSPIRPEQLLTPNRREDQGNDSWRTLNRVQENLTRGRIRGRSENGRRTRTRPIGQIDQDIRINRALFVLADELNKQVA